ncbi:MAG: phospho-N-acetylmuramoyl-pentapeptide-transferase [Oscillospiraceae bacterium]|nr:phospho-N-acetylmuramoyl-pentapeptide-transferase [Oscillospiraceae bacterium]
MGYWNSLEFQIKILLISFGTTVVLGIILIPLLKRLKLGQMQRDDGPRSHLKKQGTPTMGGIIMMFAIVIASVAGFFFYYYGAGSGSEGRTVAKRLLPLILAAFGFGAIGLADDFKKIVLKDSHGIKPRTKILGLLTVSVCFITYMINTVHIGTETLIPFLKIYIQIPTWVYVPFAIFVLLAITNSINLTDGVDGLASTVSTIIITCLTIIGIILDVKEVIIFGSVATGVCLGFLIFNLNPARVMMGDTGSLLLGGIIGILALYLKIPFIILIVAIIPVFEAISVTIQVLYFKRTGKRIFKMAPLHHHFELSGWKENKVVSVFSIITLICCYIALISI